MARGRPPLALISGGLRLLLQQLLDELLGLSSGRIASDELVIGNLHASTQLGVCS